MAFAKEILSRTFNDMMDQHSVIKKTVANTKILNSVNQSELKSTLDSMNKNLENSMEYVNLKVKEYYEGVVDRRNKAMIEDPINFIIATNETSENLFNELQEQDLSPELLLQKN